MGCEDHDRSMRALLGEKAEADDPSGRAPHCPRCRALAATWEAIGPPEEAIPSDRMRRRLDSLLALSGGDAHQPRARLDRRSFAAGLVAGLLMVPLVFAVVRQQSAPTVAALAEDVRRLRAETMVARLDSASSARRVATIASAAPADLETAEVRQAILAALRFDPSVHVRLAALDTLTRLGPPSSGELADILAGEPEPLVQSALIENILATDPTARRDLERWLRKQPEPDSDVARLILRDL